MSQYPCRFKYLKRNLTSLFRKWHSGRKSILGLERENRTHYLQNIDVFHFYHYVICGKL